METTLIKDLFRNTKSYENKEIKLEGWVRTVRDSKTFGFIVLSDGTVFSNLQVVYDEKLPNFSEIAKLNVGCALRIEGTIVATPEAKQKFELHAESIAVEGPCDETYPIQPKKHTLEFLRTINHLRPRTNTFQAVFRVRSLAAFAIHDFFQKRD